MKVERVELRRLRVPLKAPFETSFGRLTLRDCVLVTAFSGGLEGYAESVAFPQPFYSEETPETVWHMLEDFLIPRVWGREWSDPREIRDWFRGIRRNHMAVSALESALWDLHCKASGFSLAAALGATRREINVGVSIGIEAGVRQVLDNVERFLAEGYKKIKVKIKPDFDVSLIAAIRERFGMEVPLMADANSAYTLEDIPRLKELDAFELMMIEQPLAADDLVDHARLQEEISTPVCLDESILGPEDARKAIQLGSCRIINIKIGRVGGLARARAVHDVCEKAGIPVWCGGMLELGVGRAHNIALAALPNFTIAGDTSASNRSFAEDIVTPPVEFSAPGVLAVPDGPGIGYEPDPAAVQKFTVAKRAFTERAET